VKLVVTLPFDSGGCVTAQLSIATKDTDDAGNRLVSFRWEFGEAGDPGIAEMNFSDGKAFKLDYFSVMPPDYLRSFVALCEHAYNE
jgi:hypothetical protein